MRKVEKILHSVNYIRLTVISNVNVPTGSYSFFTLIATSCRTKGISWCCQKWKRRDVNFSMFHVDRGYGKTPIVKVYKDNSTGLCCHSSHSFFNTEI